MKKTFSKVRFDDRNFRWKTKLVSDQCIADSFEGRNVLADMLHAIASQPDLVSCGGQRFETLRVFHDGSCWVFEADAIVSKESLGVE